MYHIIVEGGVGEDDLHFYLLLAIGNLVVPLAHLLGDMLVVGRIAECDAHRYAWVLQVGCQTVEEERQVGAAPVGSDALTGHVQLALGGIVAEPVAERLSVGVVAIDKGYIDIGHSGHAGHHHLALGDVALGEEPRVGVAGVAALQLRTGAGGHHNRQTVAPGIAQDVGGMGRMVGTDDGMTCVVTCLGVCQPVGQLVDILAVLVMITQVQLHLTALSLLCLVEVVQCPVDAGLPFLTDIIRQHHVDVECHHLFGLHLSHRIIVVALAAHKQYGCQQRN